jgi:2-polyprenyl-6-methoxyphenol hydroxylase-like FAD-dependent oxidoreductase
MRFDAEVLIVGAGPVGLFLASELHRRGRDCVILEALREPSTHSKALAIMPGTLEIFERCGLAARFLETSNRIDGVRFVTPRRDVQVPFAFLRSRYNFVCILPQWQTQAILESRLREFGGGVLYGTRFVSLRQDEDGVEALARTARGDRRIRARYLVGCDGIHSRVREETGIPFPGRSYPGSVLLADVAVQTDVPVNEARVHVHCGGVITMFPMSDWLRRVVVVAPGEELPDRADLPGLQGRLAAAGLTRTSVLEIQWTNAFHVHRRTAAGMRSGNVLLAGDSVHTHSPVGGQGMNVGLHDAWSLASKLVRVLEGTAGEDVFDAYARERLQVAKRVLRGTDLLTRVLADPNPVLRITRESLAPRMARHRAIYEPVLRRLSQIDGRGLSA